LLAYADDGKKNHENDAMNDKSNEKSRWLAYWWGNVVLAAVTTGFTAIFFPFGEVSCFLVIPIYMGLAGGFCVIPNLLKHRPLMSQFWMAFWYFGAILLGLAVSLIFGHPHISMD
jgi:hypothetical protein